MNQLIKLLICIALLNFASPKADLDFPKDFVFGTATASYQIEGAYNQDGRGLSIWDVFSQTPGKVYKGHTGNIACDHYNRFKEDVKLMADLGVKDYRFSISWSRILPSGTLPVNQKGIDFYNNLIDELLKYGIRPAITLYHWDLPQGLHAKYGGWLNRRIIGDFVNYSELCFKYFGDRVKNWITINEPFIVTNLGYNVGAFAPGRCSDRSRCLQGDSRTEPMIVTHHMLLSHAYSVKLYREKYKPSQGGRIGITLNGDWVEPANVTRKEDYEASERKMVHDFGWFADPVYFGDYPELLKKAWGSRLPRFTEEEKKVVKGSNDFFGLNTYTGVYASYNPKSDYFEMDVSAFNASGSRVGKVYTPPWLSVVPWGIGKLLVWLSDRYGKPEIIITENGIGDRTVNHDNHHPTSATEFKIKKTVTKMELNDTHRIEFYKGYLSNVNKARKKGVNVTGYFAWSFLDNFEWADGYSMRFGLHFIDYQNNLERYKKDSAKWWKNFIAGRNKKYSKN